jgi:shikimate kinase/3-dehydroquinate synthase
MSSIITLPNLVLTGFSGTGKSTTGRIIARNLGWHFVDTDQMIIEQAGMTIPEIFKTKGEVWFRNLESSMLTIALAGPSTIVAVGGGALVSQSNRNMAKTSAIIICLEANPREIYNRLFADHSTETQRPLLNSPDPLSTIETLKRERQESYSQSQWIIQTDTLTPEQVASEAIRGWHLGRVGRSNKALLTPAALPTSLPVQLGVSSERGFSPIIVEWGNLDKFGDYLANYLTTEKVFIVTDEQVARHHLGQVTQTLHQSQIETETFIIPSGESTKTIPFASKLYAWMAKRRAQRQDVVIALGGGVIGDLAGFVAATFGRGMKFVQIPTSLAAMVDASIGGKVAVNLRAGKNLVGSFHQPLFTFIDVYTLSTLPQRELRSGWAEAIKHGLVLDKHYFTFLETNLDLLLSLEPEVTTKAVRWSAALKSAIVSMDETENNGIRTLLNYGHTLGHAIESSTGYGVYLHGEAVSIGMHAAATIAHKIGLTKDKQLLEIHTEILSKFGLPIHLTKEPSRGLKAAMLKDKKSVGNKINWILLEKVGTPIVTTEVPHDLAINTLRTL